MSARRTLYTTDQEEAALRELSVLQGTAINAIIRIALRLLLGLPVPSWAHDLEYEQREKVS